MSLKSNLINVVLVETSHPGNIGSVARAMKTMGLSRLSLVNPRKFPSGDANALAGNALDVLESATVYDSIEEAIADSTFVYATSSRNRTIQWPTVNSEEGANKIVDQSNSKKEVSILFGREDRGLTNEELQLANTHIEIPANPEYPVLNVAMSAQVLSYEIFKASHQTDSRDWHDYPEVDSKNLQKHDIIVFEVKKNKRFHVGIYTGGNEFVHQPDKILSKREFLEDRWQNKIKQVHRHKSLV